MSTENKIYLYEPLWGSWYVDELLGEGSFGKVYRIHKDEYGKRYYSAVKIISIPRSESDYREVLANGMDTETIQNYYRGYIQSIVGEMHMMQRLRGNANIVSYEDHSVIENPYGVGADILVRMELLKPLNEKIAASGMYASSVLKMGIDLCKALEVCQHYNIMHRDIKPGNIFISESDKYKLGDFGIARHIYSGANELSKKGTFPYMAPEVYMGRPYDFSIDLYSLGIVMYRLFNNNRLPFLPQPPKGVTYSENEQALTRRLSGEPMPPPANAPSGRICDVIMKACAFHPQARYASPSQMRLDLEDALILGTDYRVLDYNQNPAPPRTPQGYNAPPSASVTGVSGMLPPESHTATKRTAAPVSAAGSSAKPNRFVRAEEGGEVYTPQRIRRMRENNRNSNPFYIVWQKFTATKAGQSAGSLLQRLKEQMNDRLPTPELKRQYLAILGALAAAICVIFFLTVYLLGGFGSAYISATNEDLVGTWKASRDSIVYTFTDNGYYNSSEGRFQTTIGLYTVDSGNTLILKDDGNELVYSIKLSKNRKKLIIEDNFGKKWTFKKSE
ncbi:MAG: serine/threonine protein kinase [Oscillospiraceae bacterium]|jgi:serine/threonine protein kinase|nr:serine/threonine protein kinase [Oscillospiraceae bacterium]